MKQLVEFKERWKISDAVSDEIITMFNRRIAADEPPVKDTCWRHAGIPRHSTIGTRAATRRA